MQQVNSSLKKKHRIVGVYVYIMYNVYQSGLNTLSAQM